MINLYRRDETDFSRNGLGSLDSAIIDPEIHWVDNGIFELTFRYPLFEKHGLEIENGGYVKAPDPEIEDNLFFIHKIVPSMGYLTVSCYQIFYKLAFNFIRDTNVVRKPGQLALEQISKGTQYPHDFRFTSDIDTVASARIVRKNPVEILLDDQLDNSFINRWGGHVIRHGFDISINRQYGSDRGYVIRHKKDLVGYEATIDETSVVTRIHPVGKDGLMLPEGFVDSPLINNYAEPRIQEIEYDVSVGDEEKGFPNEAAACEELRRLAKLEFSKNEADIPHSSYKVEFVNLKDTEEYKDLRSLKQILPGDVIKVEHREDNFFATSNMVEYTFNPLSKTYISVVLGNFETSFSTIVSPIRDIRRNVRDLEEQANIIQTAANGKNTIFRGPDTPEARKVGDLWYKPAGNGEIEMYQWNGETWELIVSTGVNTEITERIKEAKDAADGAQEEAESAANRVQKAIDDADAAYDYADSAIRAANGKNTVYRGDQQPTEGKENDIWFQGVVDNGEEATKMYVHDGSAWVLRAHDASDLAGTLDLSQLNVINLNMDSATGGSLRLDRGLKVTNNDKDVLKVENGNVVMDVDNLLIQSQGLDEVMSTSFYQDGLAVGMMYEENGEIKSIFNLGPNGPYLAGDNIVLNGNTVVDGTFTVTDEMFAEKMSVDKFKAGTLNAAEVNLINVNVASLVGDTAEFIRTGWNKVNSRADIDGSRLRFTHNDGTTTEIGASGIRRVTPSDNRAYHYLIYATTFIRGVSSSNAHWIQLPDDFKGKDFKVYLAVADSMNALNYKRAIQRFVCTIHPGYSIDYARARVPIIGYKSETLSDGEAPEITSVQGLLWAIY